MVLRLEVFESDDVGTTSETVVLDTLLYEEAKLASYDLGYSAGWEDAAAAQSSDQTRITADLGRNLQSLSFTYQEARGHILRALEPLLDQMVCKVLPAMAQESLGGVVLDALLPMIQGLADAPVTLVLNPAVRAAVEPLIDAATGLPLVIEEEPSLGEGQVYLRVAQSEALVDLDRVTTEIASALRGFFELSRKES